jgi:hypothetical protein
LPVLFLWIFCPFLLLLLLFFPLPVQRVRNGCPARLIYDGLSHFLIFVSFLFCLVWDFIVFAVFEFHLHGMEGMAEEGKGARSDMI